MFRIDRLLLGAAALAAMGGWTPAAASEIVGRGDMTFYLDTAAFRTADGRALEEVYVRIGNNELVFHEADGGFQSRVKISLLVTDLDGNPVVQDAEEIGFEEDGEERVNDSRYFQTIVKQFVIEPGIYLLSYAVEDLQAPKRTVLGMLMGKNNLSTVRDVRLNVPEMPEGVPSFSLPMFVWSVDTVDGQTVYHPNPPRMYGLYQDTLIVYVELYLPESVAAEESFEFTSYILDGEGNTVASRSVTSPNPAPAGRGGGMKAYPVVIREDLSTFPAGAYTLNFSFGVGNRIWSRVRAGMFSVAWDMRTWEVSRRSFLAEARFLLGDEEFELFRNKSLGEQEQMLDALWKKEDPSPETGTNEAYEKFLDRLAYVNQTFSESVREAVFSDRGQIYMKWGPPDEFVEDVIPVNRETISEAFAKVEDKFHPFNYSTHGIKPNINSAIPRSADPRGIGQIDEGGNTAFPFELWIYNNSGDPILSRHRVLDPDIGMRFLFVDREGYGVYKLETSTKISDK